MPAPVVPSEPWHLNIYLLRSCHGKIRLALLKLSIPDDLLNIDNVQFEQMVGQIYPAELQLNKASSSDTETPFLDLD